MDREKIKTNSDAAKFILNNLKNRKGTDQEQKVAIADVATLKAIANNDFIDVISGSYSENNPKIWEALEELDDIIPKYWEVGEVKDKPYSYLKEMEQWLLRFLNSH